MTLITAEQIHQFAPACDAAAVSSALNDVLGPYQITTPLRLAHFLAQMHEETGGFTVVEENLNYTSAARIVQVWPTRFTLASAAPYVRNPQALANKVYGYRGGNTLPGSGWKWRGRGWMQITFYNNYFKAGHDLNRPYTANPDLLLLPPDAALTAAWAWATLGCNELADEDDLAAITERVNGGEGNLEERTAQFARAKGIWNE